MAVLQGKGGRLFVKKEKKRDTRNNAKGQLNQKDGPEMPHRPWKNFY